jgi:hypothetical protein
MKRNSKGQFLPAAKHHKGGGGGHHKKGAKAHHKSGGAAASTSLVKSGGTIRTEAGRAVPAVLVGGLAFLATRFVTWFGLGVNKETNERRDKGWLGFLGNAVVVIVGWIALRSFKATRPYAMAWLVGGGIAIIARGVAAAFPDKAENAGLIGNDASRQIGSDPAGTGVEGLTPAGARGLTPNAQRLAA